MISLFARLFFLFTLRVCLILYAWGRVGGGFLFFSFFAWHGVGYRRDILLAWREACLVGPFDRR